MIEEIERIRLRRLRKSQKIRDLVSETSLNVSSLIQPIFVVDGEKIIEDIDSMPGIKRYSLDMLDDYIQELVENGIIAVLIFGIPKIKDEIGSEAYSKSGIIPRTIRRLKESFPELVVAADVCLCEYTTHGHCGIVENGIISNDKTLPLLSRAALTYAESGADIVAPSAMMDHQVLSIRNALDSEGFRDTIIMSYSAKYASSLYSPFREAAFSSPKFGNRKEYQMDIRNSKEALREIEMDIKEGADIVMVKPALPNLDIISQASSLYNVPIAAYSVSGEYSMIKFASMSGYLNEKDAVLEITTSIKRAGASIIITYDALQIAKWLKG